jgi:hypothetical protein
MNLTSNETTSPWTSAARTATGGPLNLSAPSGQILAPGAYNGASRDAFKAPTVPGLDLSGNGRGCNTLTGSFAIQNVVFGPGNNVEKFDATYEQHCEGGTPALRG